jgi:two-component system, NtrC family, sensor kinase
MATSLLEREKMIESQKERLEEQNKRLQQMGELQKRLQEAEHLAGVGRLSAQVAHEVGNPLHSIGLEAELALELCQALPPQVSSKAIHLRQSMSSILSSVERLQKIIQNYLRLSKTSETASMPVDLNAVLESTVATYANSLAKMSIQVDWKFEGTPLDRVTGDADLIENAFGNLIRNSIQALEEVTDRPKKIQLVVSPVGQGKIRFTYSDNGMGMSDDVKRQLFKPFFSTKAQGTGLGLSFVKKIFNDFGGDFTLRESAPNQGVVFEGWLPEARTAQLALNSQGAPLL